jgi:hypothetical protein
MRRGALVALVAALALPPAAGAGEPEGPSTNAAKHLREMQDHLESVSKSKLAAPQKRAINDADREKRMFVGEMFGGDQPQGLFGCGVNDSGGLFVRLEGADLGVELAARANRKNVKDWLKHSADNAEVAAEQVAGCPEADEGARAIARDIANRAADLRKSGQNGQLSPDKLQTGIKRMRGAKRKLLAGQTIFDCDAYGIYELVKAVNFDMYRALEADERAQREGSVERAIAEAEKLIEFWKRVPCATGCSDAKDNDGDGLTDASDSGCLTGPNGAYDRSDRSEQHGAPAQPPCPAPGTAPVDAFFSYQNTGSRIIRHNLRGGTGSSQLLIETDPSKSDFFLGGPVDLGAEVCGGATTATAEWALNGTAISWHLRITPAPAGHLQPGNFTVHAGADTR